MRRWLFAALLALSCLLPTYAQGLAGLTCAKSGLINRGKFITDTCWGCFFPITIGGVRTSPGPLPSDKAPGMCVCPGKFGIPTPGVTLGMWTPTHTVTSTRNAFCFPELDMQLATSGLNGASMGGPKLPDQGSYRHFHLMMFPVDVIMDMFSEAVCNSGSAGIDILFISEIDPTHNNEALAMLTTPEGFLTANPVAQAACLADSVASTISKPIQALFWCGGSWGGMYPYSGFRNHSKSAPLNAALSMAKGVAMSHRRFLLKRTYGVTAVCKDYPTPMLPKQQYRYQPIYPLPSRLSNEWMGRTSLINREFRHIPGIGEDFINLLWTRQECCANF